MNLFQMLSMDVKPQPDTRAPKQWKRNTKAANMAVQALAVERYTEAIGKEWTTTGSVAYRLGLGRQSVFKQLVKYCSLGVLEQRPLGGKPFTARRGWEWRVKGKLVVDTRS